MLQPLHDSLSDILAEQRRVKHDADATVLVSV